MKNLKKNFYVVCSEFQDCSGHYFEQFKSLKHEFEKLGYNFHVIANKSCAFSKILSKEEFIKPLFSKGLFERNKNSYLIFLKKIVDYFRIKKVINNFFKGLSKFIKIDEKLVRNFFLFPINFFLNFLVRPFFSIVFVQKIYSLPLESLIIGKEFQNELEDCFKRIKFNKGDLIFFDSFLATHLFGIFLWYKDHKFGKFAPSILLPFRDPPKFILPEHQKTFLISIKLLEKLKNQKKGVVRYFCDNKNVISEYESIFPFFKKKIILLPQIINQLILKKENNKLFVFKKIDKLSPIKICFLGNCRLERGIIEVIKTIDFLSKNKTKLFKKLEFHLQIYHRKLKHPDFDKIDNFVKNLKRKKFKNVFFYSQQMSSDKYIKIFLNKMDVIFIPYREECYTFSKTSCAFTDACSSGKIVIVTRNTWMGLEHSSLSKSVVTFRNRDIEDMSKKIKYIFKNYNELKKEAINFRENYWLKKYGSKKVASKIINSVI
jgi:hypothetical protein